HRVLRFRILSQRLPQLFGSAETAAKREILPQRISLLVLLPHEDSAKIGMTAEANAEHVVTLTLHPVSCLPDSPDARHFERRALLELGLYTEKTAERERGEMPDDFNRLL